MRRVLGPLLPAVLTAALLLGGCGDDDSGDGAAQDPAPTGASSQSGSPSGSPDEAPSEPPSETGKPGTGDEVDHELVTTVTGTAAGGTVSPLAVPLDGEEAAEEFAAAFEEPLRSDVVQAVADAEVPEGMRLYGAVVAVGCEVPQTVEVTLGDGGLQVFTTEKPDPQVQCFAAMTTVALVLVPTSVVG